MQISRDQSKSMDSGYTKAGATNSFSHIRALNHLSPGIPTAIYTMLQTQLIKLPHKFQRPRSENLHHVGENACLFSL